MPKDLDKEYADLFDGPADSISILDEIEYENQIHVPNQQPTIHDVPYRIAIIGEAPGADEVAELKPFVGHSGRQLNTFLSRYNIIRSACFVGNICQTRPPGNQIATFSWNSLEIQSGITELKKDLSIFKPNICLLLGGTALHAFKNPDITPKTKKSKKGIVFSFPDSVSDWRGSFFWSHPNSPLPYCKCIASYHPAACFRQYEWTPLLMMDVGRCKADAHFPYLDVPVRTLKVKKNLPSILADMDKIILEKPKTSMDIEGYWNAWSCISFATSPTYSFIVPFVNMRGENLWTVEEETEIYIRLTKILSDPLIEKVWQNGLYDRFCIEYGYDIIVRGRSQDTMLKHWEILCELEKSLAMQTSLYTREPYYKAEGKKNDARIFWTYCCKDSAVTYENNEKMEKMLVDKARKHYEFNETLLNALLYMEKRGIRYSEALAKSRLKEVQNSVFILQDRLNNISGYTLPTKDKEKLKLLLREVMCYKRDQSMVKTDYLECFDINMRILLGEGELTSAELGRLATDLDFGLNIKSTNLKKYLYETLGLPKVFNPEGGLTTDYKALIGLRRKKDHTALQLIIDIGELRTRSQMLQIKTDPDGRVRAGYNEVGSETGRVTCYTSPTGSGYNMQTLPDENELKPVGHHLREGMRDLIVADKGCYLAKCDLKGADGWTVGANLANLGYSTMLDDLRFGLKPASVLCYGRRHGENSITGKSREQLYEMCKEVKKSDWDYFAYKQCIWGFCYLMGVRKAAEHVFNISEGTVTVEEVDMQRAKDMLFRRYNIPIWHRAIQKRLSDQPYPPKITSPTGHTRKYFGRPQEILGEALADEPQEVTTYATNRAVYNCWTDTDNRRDRDSFPPLRVEPLHQVHDEAVFQFKIEDVDWATKKIKQWFNNTITIAGIDLIIPFEGSYGLDWSMNEHSKKGTI